jgi:Astacin (Peptidase family M12A)
MKSKIAFTAFTALFICGVAQAFAQERQLVRIDDMLIEIDQPAADVARPRGAIGLMSYYGQPWPDGIIPVLFHNSISAVQRQMFFAACDGWRQSPSRPNVSCVPYSGQSNYLYVTQENDGCWSYVGLPSRGWSQLNLQHSSSGTCWGWNWPTPGSPIYHELGHAFGFAHEHQRVDRDQYIWIDYANVSPAYSSAFDRFANLPGNTFYDFASIMHYDSTAFSVNGRPTIVPRAQYSQYANSMGRSRVPTAADSEALKQIYGDSSRPQVIEPKLTIRLFGQDNDNAFWPYEFMAVNATLVPGTSSGPVDAYIVVNLPTGQFMSLQLDGRLVPGIVPIARRFTPFNHEGILANPAFKEPGTYTWYAVLTEPGTLNFVSPLQQTTFVVR